MSCKIVPCLTYRDAQAAINFLCDAFGFEKKMVVPGEGGTIAHSELVYDGTMVMVGSARETPYGAMMRSPKDAGGSTQSIYLIVDDPDGHCERARSAGADIVMEPETQDYGGRDYTCRDIEGHVWTFGTYNPWTAS